MGKGGGDDDAAAPGADTRLFWMEERISNALRLKPEKLKALQASSDARCASPPRTAPPIPNALPPALLPQAWEHAARGAPQPEGLRLRTRASVALLQTSPSVANLSFSAVLQGRHARVSGQAA